MAARKPPCVLVIAGSDPSGGAGLEADQRVLAVHGCYATTATTALTVQNTLGVRDVRVTPPEFLKEQLEAVLGDVEVDVIKIGMLASKRSIEVVADILTRWQQDERDKKRQGSIVLDPVGKRESTYFEVVADESKVMISTSGHRLLPDDAIKLLLDRLLPMSTILTPNVPEACLLAQQAYSSRVSPNQLYDLRRIKKLAKDIQELGPRAVLLKGGHIPLTSSYERISQSSDDLASLVVDVLYDGTDFTGIQSDYSRSINTHGTGCSLASAVAANLAAGKPMQIAVRDACRYVETGIKTSFGLGRGNGPINHFHSLQVLPYAPGHFIEYLLDRPDVRPAWQAFTQHEFVRSLADGSLPLDVFKRFLVQDYLYLTQFARTNALAAYKGDNMDDIVASAQIVVGVQKEMQLHLEYCQDFGVSWARMRTTKESQATIAYSRYVLEVGQSGDWLGLQVAMSSCLIGYQEAAGWAKAQPASRKEDNKYWRWIESYGGEEYAQSVEVGKAMIERHASKISPSRMEELVKVFLKATEMEINFWEYDAHLR